MVSLFSPSFTFGIKAIQINSGNEGIEISGSGIKKKKKVVNSE
ncbi:MAG: hypothetical protein ACI9M9_002281 [Flavobacteriaceae bacterium]